MKTNVKKMLGLILALALALGLMTSSAFAASTAWDGTTLTQPGQDGGVYQIGTGAELAWFAQSAAADSKAVLTADIDLGGKTWTSMATFSGTFDGQGHTVKNLTGANGLFAKVTGASDTARAVVKNVTVEGTINATVSYVAGIAGTAYNATFENCINKANVTGASGKNSEGGVIGHGMKSTNAASNLTLTNCGNEGDITGFGNGPVGGVIGGRVIGNAKLENCYNTGTITGVTTGTTAGTPAGLISYCDSTKGENYVKNCYNTGAIKGTTGYAGGLVGYVVGTSNKLENCFNAGAVTSDAKTPGTIAANIKSSAALTATNCYYLSGSASRVVGNGSASVSATSKSADDMKSAAFVETLGSSFKQGESYPVLAWQKTNTETPAAGYTVTLTADKSEVFVGDKVTVKVSVDKPVNGIQAKVEYDADLFTCDDDDVDVSKWFKDATAEIKTLTFTAKAAGEATFAFDDDISVYTGAYEDFIKGDADEATVETATVIVKVQTYTVSIADSIQNGSVSVNGDKTAFAAGETVTLTVAPAGGYQLKSLTYTAEGGTPVAIAGNTFVMPAANVTVNAEFKLIPVATYTITVPEVDNAVVTVTVDGKTYEEGEEIKGLTEGDEFTVNVTPDLGYELKSIKVMSGDAELTADNGVYTVANGDITMSVTVEQVFDVAISDEDYVTGYKLVIVTGTNAKGYTYGGETMIKIAENKYAYLTADADASKVAKNTTDVDCGDITDDKQYDVNGTKQVDFNDAGAAFGCYNEAYDVAQYMEMYLRADVNGDKTVNGTDVSAIMAKYNS